jgi:ribosomal RNA-processing protein 12
MIRKFGYDEIYRFAGEGDEKKVLVGIRRKKERAKKKKAGAGEGDGDEEGVSLFPFPFRLFDPRFSTL